MALVQCESINSIPFPCECTQRWKFFLSFILFSCHLLTFGCTFHDNHSFVNIDTHTWRERVRERKRIAKMGRDELLPNSVNSISNTIYLIIIAVWHTSKNHRQTSRRLISISPFQLYSVRCAWIKDIKHFLSSISDKNQTNQPNTKWIITIYITRRVTTLNLVGQSTW